MLAKPTAERTAPISMAARGERMPFSRSLPAGKATPAWKNAQIDSSQNVSPMLQWCASRMDFAAAPYPYSYTLTAIMAIHGSQIIQARDLPRSSRSVSPMR